MESWYGVNCSQKCTGHCREGTLCNHVTGQCERGCAAGWTGTLCETGAFSIQWILRLIYIKKRGLT